MNNAFVTGSRVYGIPKENSDIDLVVLISDEDWEHLAMASDDENSVNEYGTKNKSIRFGNLNLLVTTEQKDFDVWMKGTEELKARRPVERDEAVKLFSGLRAEAEKEV